MEKAPANAPYPDKFALRKVEDASPPTIAGILNSIHVTGVTATIPDSLESWINGYLQLAVEGIRSEAVAQKMALHLRRFLNFFVEAYGHDRISTCLRRDVVAWQHSLIESGLAHSTVNNHLASLSTFTTWVTRSGPSPVCSRRSSQGSWGVGAAPFGA